MHFLHLIQMLTFASWCWCASREDIVIWISSEVEGHVSSVGVPRVGSLLEADTDESHLVAGHPARVQVIRDIPQLGELLALAVSLRPLFSGEDVLGDAVGEPFPIGVPACPDGHVPEVLALDTRCQVSLVEVNGDIEQHAVLLPGHELGSRCHPGNGKDLADIHDCKE